MNAFRARELTARGRGAIRVLELTGPGALERVRALAPGQACAPGAFGLLALRDARGELLDEALVLVDSPMRVELHVHGAPALVERVLHELGAGPDEPVPHSLEERAEELLAAAASEAAARVLLDQAEGALRRELEALLRRSGTDFRAHARELARRGRIAAWLVRPPRVVLAGPVNAGKSTLFNVLVGRERVVVDAVAGTTRDAVRERVQLGAYAIELFDTAGERALADTEDGARVEQAGQALAAELGAAADVVLRLVPPWQPTLPARRARECVLRTHADLAETPAHAREDGALAPALSALHAPAEARRLVEESVRAALALPAYPHVPGAGVPFEPGWVDALERGEGASIERAVRAWLDGGRSAAD